MSEQIFTNTLIFLGAAIIMVPLVRKLGFSSVIGYILGGIIIYPFVLKLTGNADDVMHATEFGVVMLLFIVGLELEPKNSGLCAGPYLDWEVCRCWQQQHFYFSYSSGQDGIIR